MSTGVDITDAPCTLGQPTQAPAPAPAPTQAPAPAPAPTQAPAPAPTYKHRDDRGLKGGDPPCCICGEIFTVKCDIVIIKHTNDVSLDASRKRGHYFHRECLSPWRELHGTCPLDRDSISRVYTVPGCHVVGIELEQYGHDYYRLLLDIKVNDRLLDQLEVDDPDKNNKTLAFHACMIGNYALVNKLISRGADFNRPCGDHNFTPLMVAVCYNHYTIVAKILSSRTKSGRSINNYDRNGVTAFGYACMYSHSRIIGEFLDRELVSASEVSAKIALYRDRYRADKLYGEEILTRLHHYVRIKQI